jgi:hypothetical protein
MLIGGVDLRCDRIVCIDFYANYRGRQDPISLPAILQPVVLAFAEPRRSPRTPLHDQAKI